MLEVTSPTPGTLHYCGSPTGHRFVLVRTEDPVDVGDVLVVIEESSCRP